MQHVTTIILDLDDTLWDLHQVIRHAEETIYGWFSANYPRIAERYAIEDLRALRAAVGDEYPDMAHDLTFLRRQTYRRLAGSCDYDPAIAEVAFDVFQQARNEVVLFPEVRSVLQQLGQTHQLVALSNGNADLATIGLDVHFSAAFSARELGCAKPDPAVFVAVCDHIDVDPVAVLHVGDDPHNDVVAPKALGMQSVWVNRKGHTWPGDLPRPDYELSDLSGLPAMLAA